MPILGRQPGRELDKCPMCTQRPKDGYLPVGRGSGSWPRRGEVRVPTAGVVCSDGVSKTRFLAALLSCLARAGKGPLLLLPWPCHLSYCNWRLISKRNQGLAPSLACVWLRGRPGGGQESGRAYIKAATG